MSLSNRITVLAVSALASSFVAHAQNDTGPRKGTPAAGGPLPGLSQQESAFFTEGQKRFMEIDSVAGDEPGAPGSGLGPRFNMNSCGGCHAHPAVGGSSPPLNPQVAMAAQYGGTNTVPAFITANGPVREVRFKTSNGNPDGGVHNLFVITGRSDGGNCNIQQPDFASAAAQNNMIFRIPTPTFGAGLIEAIPDSTILANKSANNSRKQALGISGHENRNGNDGTITRFGWKAQNKSLELFAAEAYNVEQGATNEIFQTKRDETPGCVLTGTPGDHTNFTASTPLAAISDVVGFAVFMRFLAPPAPAPPTRSTQNGAALFSSAGCALCHTPSLTTSLSSSPALTNQTADLYSDLLVHNMGQGLADGISQGAAGPDEFRTAPLWGLGQRLFFLHDGRTNDLATAIQAHASSGSEANAVIRRFNTLSMAQKQDVLNFLGSL